MNEIKEGVLGTPNLEPSWTEVMGNLEAHYFHLVSEVRDNLVGLGP